MQLREPLANERGRAGYLLLWLIGVPVPVLIGIYLLRGCNQVRAMVPLASVARRAGLLGRLRAPALATLGAAVFAACSATAPPRQVASVPPEPAPELEVFEATAYSIEGTTASGEPTREGICAADPDVLPLGSRIRVHEAGAYSGECLVADTGRTIKGREIDIYLADDRAAKRFGRKKVRVEVLSRAAP